MIPTARAINQEKMETKHTSGKWYVERTSTEEGDFQGRILCKSNEKKSPHSDSPQIYRIAGEPSKRNGYGNIHVEADANLMAAAPELLKTLKGLLTRLEGEPDYWFVDEKQAALDAIKATE